MNQSRKPDEIVVVDDSSTDSTPAILQEYADHIRVVRTPKNLGNKSHAQEYGLSFITGDVFISTDADTLLHPDFVRRIEEDFADPQVQAVAGYVRSLQYNWITRHRAFEYTVFQNFHKLAQSQLRFMYVIPGAAGAFRTETFRRIISFDHDTITEDLDFTYKLHKSDSTILYDLAAIVYTQDPSNLHCYVNQLRRWLGGGWQNLRKHRNIALRPVQALELSLMYIEGMVFSALLFLVPFLNVRMALQLGLVYLLIIFFLSTYAAVKERRPDLLLVSIPYLFLTYVNAYVFMEQFFREIILKRSRLVWISPKRTA